MTEPRKKTVVTDIGEQIADDPDLMSLKDCGSGARAAELLYAAAQGVEEVFNRETDADARRFADALRALADKHCDKPRVALVLSVVS